MSVEGGQVGPENRCRGVRFAVSGVNAAPSIASSTHATSCAPNTFTRAPFAVAAGSTS